MKTIKTIIIDDEDDGREALRMATEYCPQLEIIDICESGLAGLKSISKNKPDLVFLDIQMPHMSGFEMLQQIKTVDFHVIFVTAFDQYAIKAIKFSVLDYLLKPIDIDELQTAIKKVELPYNLEETENQLQALYKNVPKKNEASKRFAVPTLKGLLFVNASEIIYCLADGNYTTLFLTHKRELVVSKALGDFEEFLENEGFYRVHHSSLINLTHLQEYVKGDGGYVILTDGYHADVSRRKKEQFLKQLQLF